MGYGLDISMDQRLPRQNSRACFVELKIGLGTAWRETHTRQLGNKIYDHYRLCNHANGSVLSLLP